MWTPFADIVARFRKPQEPTFNFTEAQLQELRSLVGEPGFDRFVDALDRLAKLSSEGFLAPSMNTDLLHYTRGYVAGLRKAATLVDEILAGATYRARLADAAATDPSIARAAALYATPAWRK